MLAASLAISALILVFYHSIKRSLPERHAKRVLLRDVLRQFAIANRESELTSAEIEDFWAQTAGTYALCRNTATNELRNELYNNALLLLNTRSLLTDPAKTSDQQFQLMKLHTETIQWFSVALVQMDADFLQDPPTHITVQDVWAEFVRLLCHAIRA